MRRDLLGVARGDDDHGRGRCRQVRDVASLQVCFATSGNPFTAKTGPVPFDYDGDEGEEGLVGLLTDCPVIDNGPCVTARGNLNGGGAYIEFLVPGSLGDPRYH